VTGGPDSRTPPESPAGAPPEAAPPAKRPGRVRRWVVRPFLWGLLLLVVLVAGVYLFFQSELAHRRAVELVIARASEAMDRDVLVGDIDYSFRPLAFELWDVVIPSPDPRMPPLARIPYARAEFSWRGLRSRILRLEEVQVVRPEVYLQFNPDGTNNLPDFQREEDRPSRFEFQLGRIVIDDGTLRVNERRLPLRARAEEVHARLTGTGKEEDPMKIQATAQNVVATLPEARPYPFTLSARATLVPGRVTLDVARISSPELRARVQGWFDFEGEDRRAELEVQASGGAELASRLGYVEQPISGPFTFRGRVGLVGGDLGYSGTVASPRLAFEERVFQDLEAGLVGGPDGLEIDLERAGWAGGTVRGEASISLGERAEERPGVPIALDLAFSGLALRQLFREELGDEALPVLGALSGRADGTFRYRFNTEDPLGGTGFADIQVAAVQDRGGVPISGDVPLRIDRGVLTSRNVQIQAPDQTLLASDFRYDLRAGAGRAEYQLTTRDLGALAPLLLADAPAGEERPPWLPTSGIGIVEGTATFGKDDFRLRAELDLANVATPAVEVDSVAGSFTVTPQAVEDLRVEATRNGGALLATGRIPIPEEAGAPVAIELMLDVVDWPTASLAGLVPGDFDVRGSLSGQVDLGGTTEDLTGSATLRVAGLELADRRVGDVLADVSFAGDRIAVDGGVVATPAGDVLLAGVYRSRAQALDFTLDAPSLDLSEPPLEGMLPGLTGQLVVGATVEGTLDAPEAVLRIAGRELALNGEPLDADGTTELLATWDGRRVRAEGTLLGLAAFEGGGLLTREAADVLVEVRSDNVGALARLLAPEPLPDFQGALLGSVSFEADFSESAWRATARLPELRLSYEEHTVSNLEPVVVELGPERVRIESLFLGDPESGSELFVTGTLGLGEGQPLNLRVQSTLDASWAELFVPGMQVEGAVDLLATVRGTAGNPVLNGSGDVRDGELILPGFPQALEDVRGQLSFTGNRVILEGIRAEVGGGTLRATGQIGLPREGEELSYRLNLLGRDLSLRYPEGFLTRGGAEVTIASEPGGGRVVRGFIDLERVFYLEDVEVGTIQILQRALRRQRVEVAETEEALSDTELNLVIEGENALRVRNNIANLEGDVELTVRGTAARPVVFGDIEVEPGGTLVYNETEYRVERGRVTFSNPYRLDPVIDLVATTEVQRFDIGMTISGTLDQLDVDFTSDPNLADLEVLSLLATGQTSVPGTGAAEPGAAVGGSQLAQQFLYGQAASALSKRVGTLFGLDRFRIAPATGAAAGAGASVGLTVGKRLSKNLFVTYQNATGTEDYAYIVQVEWQVADNVTLVLSQKGSDIYALDAVWERSF
jgi:hypothetical protein